MKTNVLTTGLLLLLMVGLLLRAPRVTWTTAKVVGAAIAGVALPLLLLARWQLGASFTVGARANKLVKTGLYARLRNPIYLFGGLTIAALSLFVSVWGPLVVALVLIPLQRVRARKEEEVLAEAFGQKYARYKDGTWF